MTRAAKVLLLVLGRRGAITAATCHRLLGDAVLLGQPTRWRLSAEPIHLSLEERDLILARRARQS